GDRNRSHWSTSKTPSYTKSVSWQHHPVGYRFRKGSQVKWAVSRVRVVLKGQEYLGKPYFILTSYPFLE
ncbi:MAG: hypothetical protein KIB04_17730, partial [Pantoea sp.]|nr:hypothetical protein [Pantoea sp.]